MKAFIVSLIGSKRTARRLAAKRVRDCFGSKPWDRHIFHWNPGTTIKTEDGETKFYKASDVEPAMKKLDAVLRDLSR